MKQSLSLRTAQHLTLTPQLQQSIRLLQLSTLELTQEVQQQLSQNPFLEFDEGEVVVDFDNEALPEASGTGAQDGPDSDNTLESQLADGGPDPVISEDWAQLQEAPAYEAASEWEDGLVPASGEALGQAPSLQESLGAFEGVSAHRGSSDSGDDDDWLQARSASLTLAEHLRAQCAGWLLDETGRAALLYLIDNLDDNGFLAEALTDLAPDFINFLRDLNLLPVASGASEEDALTQVLTVLEEAQDRLQQMDPLGVGASDVAGCLRLQLLARLTPAPTPRSGALSNRWAQAEAAKIVAVALKVIRHPFDLIAKRDYRQLSRLCQVPEVSIRSACELIKSLEPQPARPFASTQLQEMVPDVVVRRQGAAWEVQLNPQAMPRLRVNDFTAPLVTGEKLAAHPPLQQALLDARWFVKSVAQRFDTILRVSRCIVARQSKFFEKGPLALKPMVLREVADELGLHESTISRVTTAKFMATPLGTFELKYFFTSGLSSDGGQETSSTAVRALIRQWVDQENPARPLSDQKLTEMLADQGIVCARRTVAKYREALKIAPTSLRRAH